MYNLSAYFCSFLQNIVTKRIMGGGVGGMGGCGSDGGNNFNI